MALNPQLDRAPIPTGVGYSSGAGSGDRSGALRGQATQSTLEGLGATLETLAGTADAVVKQKIYSDVNADVDATRALFGADDATAASGVIPTADASQAKSNLARLQNAYEQGTLKASDYYARLNAQVKQLKSRYPGYEQEVDQMVQSATGVNPANALVSSLRSEADAAAASKDAAQVRWETYEKQNQGLIERVYPGYFTMPVEKKPTPQQVMDGVARIEAQDSQVASLKAQLELKVAQKSLSDDELLDGARQTGAMRMNQIVTGSFTALGTTYQDQMKALSEAMANPLSVSPEQQSELQMGMTQLMLTATTAIQTELSTGPFGRLDPTQRNNIVQDALKPIQIMVDAVNNKDYGVLQAQAAFIQASQDSAGAALIKDGGDSIQQIMAIKGILPPEAFSLWLSEHGGMNAVVEAVRLSTKAGVAAGDPNVTLNGTVDTIESTPGTPSGMIPAIVKDALSVIASPMMAPEIAKRNIDFLYGPGSENFTTRFKDDQQATVFATIFSPETSAAIKQQWAKDNPELFTQYKKSAMVQFQQIARPLIDDINSINPEYAGLIEVTFNQSTGQLEARPVEGATIPGQIAGLEMIPQQSMIHKYRDLNKLLLSLKGIYDVEGKDFGKDVDAVLQTMGVRYSNPLSPDERQVRPDLTKRQTSDINPTVNEMLSFVASLEAPGGFNQISGGSYRDLENMTVDEVIKLQGEMVASGETPSSAVGGMQIIRSTLAGLKEKYGLTGKEFFSEQLQRQLGVALMEGRGLSDYLLGKIDAETFADNLAREWAALPLSNGKSAYAGVGKNKALTDRATVIEQISKLSGQTAMNFPGVDLTDWELDPDLLLPQDIDSLTETDSEGNYINQEPPPLDAKLG